MKKVFLLLILIFLIYSVSAQSNFEPDYKKIPIEIVPYGGGE